MESNSYWTADAISAQVGGALALQSAVENETGQRGQSDTEWARAIDRALFWLGRMPKYHTQNMIVYLHAIEWPSFQRTAPSYDQLTTLACLRRVLTIWESACRSKCTIVAGQGKEVRVIRVVVSLPIDGDAMKALAKLGLLEEYRSFPITCRVVSHSSPGVLFEKECRLNLLEAETSFDFPLSVGVGDDFDIEVYHLFGLRAVCRPERV